MEAEERPRKFRKLGVHEAAPVEETAEEAHALLPPTVTEAANETVDASSSSNSKPEEPAANVADIAEEENDHLEDNSEPEPNSRRQRDPDPAELERVLLQRQESSNPGQPLSKSQLKKLRKREEWEAGREYRKVKRKQKMQEKKVRKREAQQEEVQQLQLLQPQSLIAKGQGGAAKPSSSKPKFRRPAQLPITILIDCGFDNLMMEKERISLGSQITRAYSDNHRAPYQTHLVVSSWGGLLKKRFDTTLNKHYLNWKGVSFDEADFVEVAKKMEMTMKIPTVGGKLAGCFEKFCAVTNPLEDAEHEQVEPGKAETAGSDIPVITTARLDPDSGVSVEVELNGQTSSSEDLESAQKDIASAFSEPTRASENPESAQKHNAPTLTEATPSSPSQPLPTPPPQGETIYLTSDSPHTLSRLSPFSTYIIGGLVDKNRHKGICYKTARDRGIQTAKLPIGEYLEMSSRKVLATNHVVEILLRWLEEASGPEGEEGAWGRAFLRVIPQRKGGKLRRVEEDGDEEEDRVEDGATHPPDGDAEIGIEQSTGKHEDQQFGKPDRPHEDVEPEENKIE